MARFSLRPIPVSTTDLTGRSILVVDDEDVFLHCLAEGIATELPGVEVFTAHDGAEALDVLDEHVIDLTVTDVTMPGMDGMALVAAMVSRGIQVPVIMVTASACRRVELKARRYGVISVIDKPIDLASLLEVCGNTLRSKIGDFPAEVAAADDTDAIRSELRVMGEIQIEGWICDILITLETRCRPLMPLRRGTLFLYIEIDRRTGHLTMARHELETLEKDLTV